MKTKIKINKIVIAFMLLIVYSFKVYSSSDKNGKSPSIVYDNSDKAMTKQVKTDAETIDPKDNEAKDDEKKQVSKVKDPSAKYLLAEMTNDQRLFPTMRIRLGHNFMAGY